MYSIHTYHLCNGKWLKKIFFLFVSVYDTKYYVAMKYRHFCFIIRAIYATYKLYGITSNNHTKQQTTNFGLFSLLFSLLFSYKITMCTLSYEHTRCGWLYIKESVFSSFHFYRKGKRRVTRMVCVVVLAFAVCWLPIQVSCYKQFLNNIPSRYGEYQLPLSFRSPNSFFLSFLLITTRG